MLPLMGVGTVLSWLLAIAVVVALVRWLRVPDAGRARSAEGPPDTAQTTLDLRFARGEIDVEEYRERSRLLAER